MPPDVPHTIDELWAVFTESERRAVCERLVKHIKSIDGDLQTFFNLAIRLTYDLRLHSEPNERAEKLASPVTPDLITASGEKQGPNRLKKRTPKKSDDDEVPLLGYGGLKNDEHDTAPPALRGGDEKAAGTVRTSPWVSNTFGPSYNPFSTLQAVSPGTFLQGITSRSTGRQFPESMFGKNSSGFGDTSPRPSLTAPGGSFGMQIPGASLLSSAQPSMFSEFGGPKKSSFTGSVNHFNFPPRQTPLSVSHTPSKWSLSAETEDTGHDMATRNGMKRESDDVKQQDSSKKRARTSEVQGPSIGGEENTQSQHINISPLTVERAPAGVKSASAKPSTQSAPGRPIKAEFSPTVANIPGPASVQPGLAVKPNSQGQPSSVTTGVSGTSEPANTGTRCRFYPSDPRMEEIERHNGITEARAQCEKNSGPSVSLEAFAQIMPPSTQKTRGTTSSAPPTPRYVHRQCKNCHKIYPSHVVERPGKYVCRWHPVGAQRSHVKGGTWSCCNTGTKGCMSAQSHNFR